jgi:hypothetical protein
MRAEREQAIWQSCSAGSIYTLQAYRNALYETKYTNLIRSPVQYTENNDGNGKFLVAAKRLYRHNEQFLNFV